MNDPRLLAILTIILWSFGAYLARLISMRSPFVMLSLSYAFTLLTFLIYFTYQHRGTFWRQVRSFRATYLLLGPFGYFVYSMGTQNSFRAFDSASETTILNYTWPIFTVVFTELLRKRTAGRSAFVRAVEGVGVAVGFLSVVVLATRGNVLAFDISNVRGIGWGLLAGMSYGLFSSYSATVASDEQGIFLLSSVSVSLVLMLGVAIPDISMVRAFTLEDVIIVAAMGALLNGMGYVVWTRANRLAREREISISSIASLMFALPLLSLVVVTLLLKETKLFEPYFIVSLVLVILSSVLCRQATVIAACMESDISLR